MSHTYAILVVSPEAYAEIREKLRHAGYDHALQCIDGGEVLDMHGIALRDDQQPIDAHTHWRYSRGSPARTHDAN